MGRTLVIHPGALGDVLLAVPALRALRREHPRDDLVLAAQSRVGQLLLALGVVDDARRFDALGLDALFADAPPASPIDALSGVDRVVCWFGSKDPRFATRLRLLVPHAIVTSSTSADRVVWKHLLATITDGAPAGCLDCVPIPVPPELVDEGRRVLEAAGWDGAHRLVMVHPGASGPAKRWPADGFAQVITAVAANAAIVVHEGPVDGEPVGEVLARVPAPVLRLDNPALAVLAGALAHASAYLGNDSGVSHLAAAVGASCVVLFTSSETLSWRPWAPAVETRVVSSMSPADVDEVQAVTDVVQRLV